MVDLTKLPRRERQIMDFLIANGGGTTADVVDGITDAPSYSAVRATLTKLERKGYVTHEDVNRTYRYQPVAQEQARRSAVQHLLDTFFGGSTAQAVGALVKSDNGLSAADLDRLEQVVAEARKNGGRR
jgi:predicted transcriptional regulator